MPSLQFDAEAATCGLQEAVSAHDRARLEQLVSDRFLIVSARLPQIWGKQQWIQAAVGIEWSYFNITSAQALELDGVALVHHELEQEMQAVPAWAPAGARAYTRWLTSDVWVVEDGSWRLLRRHPELAS